mmetsp:Transcript_34259/g.96539  ORF Transcript_34259/g.96539 Transcript_34259/m.96539 type:complete len:330 (+) Transcript_34259:37-1026(+)
MAAAPRRVDLKPIKLQIQRVLKENAHQYWEILRSFVLSRISKREMDLRCRELFKGHLILHNWLIIGIIGNAHVGDIAVAAAQDKTGPSHLAGTDSASKSAAVSTSTTDSKSSKSKKRKATKPADDKKGRKKKKVSGIETVGGLGIPASSKLVSLYSNSLSTPQQSLVPRDDVQYKRYSKSLRSPNILLKAAVSNPSVTAAAFKAARPSETDKGLRYTQSVVALKQKLLLIAQRNNLSSVSPDCTAYLFHALGYHMKDIMNQCLPHVRGGVRHEYQDEPVDVYSTADMRISRRRHPDVILPEDISVALQMAPHLLPPTVAIERERTSFLL